MSTSTKIPNRLINEKSPYLLQHAYNPVDWYPWGEEAFEKARLEDKPVFLSIGYSTCHWCHVMAHESFESEAAATVLRAHFVAVKVDREERPDIDMVYMNVCQAMTGSGGWPLTIIMTPEKKPFYAGTYLPLHSVYDRMGLVPLLEKVAALWREERGALIGHGEKVAARFAQTDRADGAADAAGALEDGFHTLESMFDDTWGGFSRAPKFPMPHYVLYLLDGWKAGGGDGLADMARKTLLAMYRGGIFDHVGGGFARYSTDERWLTPHFEKMLYDNALLLRAYAQGYAATGDGTLRYAARKTAKYLMRDMQSPEGGFYAAEDADSEGEEGRFYVWRYETLRSELGAGALARLESRYGLTQKGNFEGKTILNRIGAEGAADAEDEAVLDELFELRKKRVPPFKDTKISAAWNGLAIEAFARAGAALDEPAYTACAQRAADFVLARMTDGGALICGTYMDGPAGPAFLADYANLANGLLALFVAAGDPAYIAGAQALAQKMCVLFADEGGFAMTPDDAEKLFMRPRDEYDGAMPSGSACAVTALIGLWRLTGADEWRAAADAAIEAMLPMAAASPAAHIHFLAALLRRTAPHRQIVIAANAGNAGARQAHRALLQRHDPFTTLIRYDKSARMDAAMPQLKQYKTDAPFAGYVCENFACKQPVYTAAALLELV